MSTTTDEGHALLELMAELEGDDALIGVYSMGLHGRELDEAVAAAASSGWKDGTAVLDALRDESDVDLYRLYNLDPSSSSTLDVAVFGWRERQRGVRLRALIRGAHREGWIDRSQLGETDRGVSIDADWRSSVDHEKKHAHNLRRLRNSGGIPSGLLMSWLADRPSKDRERSAASRELESRGLCPAGHY